MTNGGCRVGNETTLDSRTGQDENEGNCNLRGGVRARSKGKPSAIGHASRSGTSSTWFTIRHSSFVISSPYCVHLKHDTSNRFDTLPLADDAPSVSRSHRRFLGGGAGEPNS